MSFLLQRGFTESALKYMDLLRQIQSIYANGDEPGADIKPRFSIRRTCGAIGMLTGHFRLFFLLFVDNSSLLAPHSQQNCLEKCIRHHCQS
ncbi:MAG: hypothetical protein H7252_05005 [Cytophaga sp.]|nr:hypothetical protein [Undibacterium sp.]